MHASTFRYNPPPLLTTATPAAFASASRLVASSTFEHATSISAAHSAAAAVPPSPSPSPSSPDRQPSPSASLLLTLSPPQYASRRTADPYEVCRGQLAHLVELQDEQAHLVGQLHHALVSSVQAPEGEARWEDNRENIFPGSTRNAAAGLPIRETSVTKVDREGKGVARDVSDAFMAAAPSSVVHRLRVLQHESAELASKHCFPAVQHLLSTFESYWTWKRAHMPESDVMSDGQQKSDRADSVNSSSQAANVGPSHTTRSKDFTFHANASSSSSLRQRYEHARRVCEELESFTQLHAEAVHALEPYLQQWMDAVHTSDSSSAARSIDSNTARTFNKTRGTLDASLVQPFKLYVHELLEVTQTTRHVGQLLLSALAALCRPASRTEQNTIAAAGAKAHDTQQRQRQSSLSESATAGLRDRSHSAGNVDVAVLKQTADNTDGSSSANRRNTEVKSTSTLCLVEARAKSRSPRTPSRQREAAHRNALTTSSSSTRKGEHNNDNNDLLSTLKDSSKGEDNAWIGVLSPLTPPPSSSPQGAQSAQTCSRVASASPVLPEDFSPSPRKTAADLRSSKTHYAARGAVTGPQRDTVQGYDNVSVSPSSARAPSASAAQLSPSPDAADVVAAVSLSPLTVQRRAASVEDSSRRQSRSRSNSVAEVNNAEQRHSVLAQAPSLLDAPSPAARTPASLGKVDFVSAAVSPPPLAAQSALHLSVYQRHDDPQMVACADDTKGVRSLLLDLASAQSETVSASQISGVVGAGKLASEEPQRRDCSGSSTRDKDMRATMEKQKYSFTNSDNIAGASTAVYVPPDDVRSASPRSPSLTRAYAAAERSHGRSSSQPTRSVSPRAQTATTEWEVEESDRRAPSVPALLRPRLNGATTVKDRNEEKSESVVEQLERTQKASQVVAVEDAEPASNVADVGSPPSPQPFTSDRTRVDTSLFYTSPSVRDAEKKTHQAVAPSPLPVENMEAETVMRASSPTQLPTSHEHEAQRGMKTRTTTTAGAESAADAAAQHTRSPWRTRKVEVEELEREADAIEAALQRSQPARFHQRRHLRWRPSRTPSVDAHTASSTMSSSSSSSTSSKSSSSSSSDVSLNTTRERIVPHHHHPPRRHSRHRGSEREVERAVRRELKALRAAQHRDLQRVQADVRAALDDVISIASTAAAAAVTASNSSRASSRHSVMTETEVEVEKKAEHDGTNNATADEHTTNRRQRSPGAERKNAENVDGNGIAALRPRGRKEVQTGVSITQSADLDTAEATSEAEKLREALAAAEERATRLEQLNIQLKKRMWLAELSNESGAAKGHAVSSGEAARGETQMDGKRHHVSLRDAFVYGGASAANGQRDKDVDADGALAEERALLYLVDRALAERKEKLSNRSLNDVLFSSALSFRTPPKQNADQHTDGAANTDDNKRMPESVSTSSPLKCFDDINEAAWRRRQDQQQQQLPTSRTATLLGAGRSPHIRQRRASIFERLRSTVDPLKSTTLPSYSNDESRSRGGSSPHATTRAAASLSPPPPMQPLPSNVMRTVTPLTQTVAAAAVKEVTYAHPYSFVGGKPILTPAHATPSEPRHALNAASTTSQYYASISKSGARSPFSTEPDGASASSLRAEQVLSNARRLLQRRNDAHQQRRVNAEADSYYAAEAGQYADYGEKGETGYTPDEAHRSEFEFTAPYETNGSVPGSSYIAGHNHYNSSSKSYLPPPPSYTDVVSAAPNPFAEPSRNRSSSPHQDRHARVAQLGHLQSPSGEVQYYGYDTSPCSAVAYSSSKIPRPSPHREEGAAAAHNAQRSRSSNTQPHVDDPKGYHHLHHEREDSPKVRQPLSRERVDSATSPITPIADRDGGSHSASTARHGEDHPYRDRRDRSNKSNRGIDSTPRVRKATSQLKADAESRKASRNRTASLRRGGGSSDEDDEGASDSPQLREVPHQERSLPQRASSAQSSSSYDTESGGDDVDDDEDDHRKTAYERKSQFNRRRNGSHSIHSTAEKDRASAGRQVRWRDDEGGNTAMDTATKVATKRSISQTASRNSSVTSSRGSAQETMLDELNHQAAVLRRALDQLHQQQHQLAEKRVQVSQAAAARQQGPGPRGKEQRSAKGANKQSVRGAVPEDKADAQLRTLMTLLERLNAADDALAQKEQRVEQALRVIERQRAALVSDDFL